MTSDGELYAERADESLHDGDTQQAQVWVLLGIRSELRTANLIAVAAGIPVLRDAWGRRTALPPEARLLVGQIRAELDLPDEEPHP